MKNKYINYYFSGFGYSAGKYKIKNSDIEEAINKGFLQGFSSSKLEKSENFLKFKESNPEKTTFDYFAGYKMGFFERHHVTPFPPTAKKLYYAETSLDLAVKAIEQALKDSCLVAGEIDAWMISTVSPHEQAPGIAATIKSYFVDFDNHTPTFSLCSGCAGFNMNLEAAINYFKTNPKAKNIVVAHTETMSSFLKNRIKFVPFVTFGDASAAVIISKTESDEKFGIQSVVNFHDLKMLDYVGVNKNEDLYMDDSLIKDRATINLPIASKACLEKTNWTVEEIDLLVPHQTGNVILQPAAEELGVPNEKLYLEAQNYYGNVSGSTVPLSLALLNEQNRLSDNMKILSATAGVGGNFGAFSYITRSFKKKNPFNFHLNELKGKSVLVLGASGKIGYNLAIELSNRGANLLLHGNKNTKKLTDIRNATIFKADFNDTDSINNFINSLADFRDIDYLINAAGSLNDSEAMNINFYGPVNIINSLIRQIKLGILSIGTAAEDFELEGFDSWISSNRAFHGYLASASGEFLKYGIRTVYLQPGIIEIGLSEQIPQKYKFKFMLSTGQASCLNISNFCNNVANSLYLPKVLDVQYSYENAMLVGRMGYKLEVDI
ncbi:MAG: SDR family NAD(P)-dependent oxidoreductase [Bacteroidales bacterium]|nr:SDR family NAD(P)-dependent oxidoreductase [Bacteroidales bacterium]